MMNTPTWIGLRGSLVLVAALCAAGCADEPAEEAPAPPQVHDECRRYLSCLLGIAPQSYGQALQSYGEGSECWRSDEQSRNCALACDGAFAQLSSMCTCTDTTCMPTHPEPACADPLEPNDLLGTAFVTAIGPNAKTISYRNLTICPASEVDMFRMDLSAGEWLEAVVLTPAPAPIFVRMLDASGNTYAYGLGAGNQIRLVTNPQAGRYYLRILATSEVTYQLAISVAN
jgi:hypothetical protein